MYWRESKGTTTSTEESDIETYDEKQPSKVGLPVSVQINSLPEEEITETSSSQNIASSAREHPAV